MTVHTIRIPDRAYGREMRTIVWDDEAGAVSGDYFGIEELQEAIRRKPLDASNEGRILVLEDPAHDPRDFLRVLADLWSPILDDDRHLLPESFRDVEPTPILPAPGMVQDADGIWRPMYDDMVF